MVRPSVLFVSAIICFISSLTVATPVKQHDSFAKIPISGNHDLSHDDDWDSLTPDQHQACLLNSSRNISALSMGSDQYRKSEKMSCDLIPDAEAMNDYMKAGDMMNGPNPKKHKKYITKLERKMADGKLFAKIMSVDKKKLSKHKKLKRSILSKLIRIVKTKKEQVRLGKRSPDVQAYVQLQKNLSPLQAYSQKLIGKMIENKNIREHIITEATDVSSLLRKLIDEKQADKIVTALKSLDESPASIQKSRTGDITKRDIGINFATGVVFAALIDGLGIFGAILFIFIMLPFLVVFDLLQIFVACFIYIGILLPFALLCLIFSPCLALLTT